MAQNAEDCLVFLEEKLPKSYKNQFDIVWLAKHKILAPPNVPETGAISTSHQHL